MAIAVSEEHVELAEVVGRWAARHVPTAAVRATVDGDDGDRAPAVWSALAEQGLLALHVPEAFGGAGYGDVELAVVVEQLGRALVPGPVLPTLHASRLLVESADEALAAKVLPGLASGELVAAVAVEPDLTVTREGDQLVVAGTLSPVAGAHHADLLLVGGRDEDDADVWVVLDATDVEVRELPSADRTRRVAEVEVAPRRVPEDRVLSTLTTDRVGEIAVLLYAAEAAGTAGWALDEASGYAKVREQFGRPIGQFQAVKHLCADLLVRAEQARAATWDLATVGDDPVQRRLVTGVAAAVALEAAVSTVLDTIQILGGIGFTWEHDAHLYLKRATAVRQLLGAADRWRGEVARAAVGGARRSFDLALEDDEASAATRAEVREMLGSLPGADPDRRRAIVDAGLAVPHWPAPYGRDAGAREQLVIAEELKRAGVRPPELVIAGWILPTIIAYGTSEQQERFVRPTLLGELTWCQLFSEPGAGSDLAALSTRAERVDGGWRLTGQKVWTSLAHDSDWGLALARVAPEHLPEEAKRGSKHAGITAFLVDMRSAGIDIRPLREITGREMFNEVFLEDVHVPDDLVCGPVGGGWKAARTTLANERVAMSSGSSMGFSVEGVVGVVADHDRRDDPLLLDRLGTLVCEGQVLGALSVRTTLRQLSGTDPGAASSVRKLVSGGHAQRCADLRLELLGPAGAVDDGDAQAALYQYLNTQCLTIAGGTTAVQRNVVAERLLGLPRDP